MASSTRTEAAERGEPTPADPERSQRADARRNRERVLAAAETVFAAKGVGASTEDVAREAGVGVGTVFRHFPTKVDLLQAVVVSRWRRFADEAQALAADPDVEPGEAFFVLFARAADHSATKSAVAAALADAGVDLATAASPAAQAVRQALESILLRAQQAGAVRDDIGVDEVIALLIGASRAAEYAGWDREVLARTVAIIGDGLRPPHQRKAVAD